MTRSDFVVRRIGDAYVATTSQSTGRPWRAAVGVAMALIGLRRRGMLGWGAALAGGAMVVSAMRSDKATRQAALDAQQADEKADVQSEESFPASDPPASTTSTASGAGSDLVAG